MSTEVRSGLTDELFGWTWASTRGRCLELGNVSNAMELSERLRSGERFYRLGVGEFTLDDFNELLDSDRCTFGEFGGTVEVGSGEVFRLSSDV